ncbi:MAG: hypothetical protein ACHQRM_00410 [Bacteroidia bacterium]
MEKEKSHFENVAEKATDFLKTNLDLGELKAMEYGSNAFGAIMGKVILLMLGFCCLIFLSLGLAVFISSVSGNPWLGYACVSGFYLLVFLLVYANRHKWLHNSLADAFVGQFNKNSDKHPADVRDLKHLLTETQSRKTAQEQALKSSVDELANSLKPETILLSMASRVLNHYMDRKEEKEEKKEKEEHTKSSFKEPLINLAAQFASEGLGKLVDFLRKKVFK